MKLEAAGEFHLTTNSEIAEIPLLINSEQAKMLRKPELPNVDFSIIELQRSKSVFHGNP